MYFSEIWVLKTLCEHENIVLKCADKLLTDESIYPQPSLELCMADVGYENFQNHCCISTDFDPQLSTYLKEAIGAINDCCRLNLCHQMTKTMSMF